MSITEKWTLGRQLSILIKHAIFWMFVFKLLSLVSDGELESKLIRPLNILKWRPLLFFGVFSSPMVMDCFSSTVHNSIVDIPYRSQSVMLMLPPSLKSLGTPFTPCEHFKLQEPSPSLRSELGFYWNQLQEFLQSSVKLLTDSVGEVRIIYQQPSLGSPERHPRIATPGLKDIISRSIGK